MNSEQERRYLNDDKDLPIVLVHGYCGEIRGLVAGSGGAIQVSLGDSPKLHGASSWKDLDEWNFAIKDLADEVVAAVRAEGKQRFDLVGGSLGAAVATCIAAEYPEMVRSLVSLVSGFHFQPWRRSENESTFKLWLRLESTDKVAFTRLLLASGLSPGFLSAFDEITINGIIENFIASTDWRLIEQAIRVDLSLEVREYAARIKTPTLYSYCKAHVKLAAASLLGESGS